MQISDVQGISVSVFHEDEILYFSSGYADISKGLQASENFMKEQVLNPLVYMFVVILILLIHEAIHALFYQREK